MARVGDEWVSPCGRMTLRCGRYQDVLADVEADHLVTDPPYSDRTHAGALSATGERGVNGYGAWSPADAATLVEWASPRVASWMAIHTDDVLGPAFLASMRECGRYAFPLVPVLQHQPRQQGDGHPQHGHYLAVSRPRDRRFVGWGSLSGWYVAGRDGSFVRGGKPLGLVRKIVREHSRPGELVCDPCAGGGTTLLAAAMEGRCAVGAEMDPETFANTVKRLSRGYTPPLWAPEARASEQVGLGLVEGDR